MTRDWIVHDPIWGWGLIYHTISVHIIIFWLWLDKRSPPNQMIERWLDRLFDRWRPK